MSWPWTFAAALLVAIRLLAALCSPIPDCDEVFNYWEPTHYLLYGEGLQTWEYSPAYAIRSYAYVALHAAVAFAASLITSDRVAIFYAVRCVLGIVCALCEMRFARRVAHAAGADVGWLTFWLLLTSAGMFHAGVAYLPSSFAMLLLTNAWSAWIGPAPSSPLGARAPVAKADYATAIWCVGAAFYLGWPFVVVAAAPLALDAICCFGLLRCVKAGAAATLALVLPSAAFDSYMYGRSVLAFLNILLYNSSASSGSGAQLYGVEPWHFYLHNLALNFNGTLLAALLAPPILVLRALFARNGGASQGAYRADKKSDTPVGGEVGDEDDEGGALPAGRLLLLLSGLYVWVGFFSASKYVRTQVST